LNEWTALSKHEVITMTRTIQDELGSKNNAGREPCDVGHAECTAETERAINVTIRDGLRPGVRGRSLWVPKSVIHDDSEVYGFTDDSGTGRLIVYRWFAEKEDLVEVDDDEGGDES
jgi:hypothetical protein